MKRNLTIVFALLGTALFGYEVSVGSYTNTPGRCVAVPIAVDTVKGAANVGVRLTYDPQVLDLQEVRKGSLAKTLADDFVVVTNGNEGVLNVAAFGSGNANGDVGGTLAEAVFKVRLGTQGRYSDVTVSDVHVGEATGVKDLTVGAPIRTTSGAVWVGEAANVVEPGGEMEFTPEGWKRPIVASGDWLIEKGVVEEGELIDTARAKLAAKGKNGILRYQSYLLGLAPEEESVAEQLKVTFEGFDDEGLPIIGYTPKPKDATRVNYVQVGKPDLSSDDWVEVTDENKADMRFYRIKVEIVP